MSTPESNDLIECKECGKKFPVLGMHLKRKHGLTSKEYLAKHGDVKLSSDSFRNKYRGKKISDEKIILDAKKIIGKKKNVTSGLIRGVDERLYGRIFNRFKKWKWFCEIANIDYKKTNDWSDELLLEKIHELKEEGIDLSNIGASDYCSGIIDYAIKRFESWPEALKFAGINIKSMGYIKCQVCNKYFSNLTAHVKKHNMTIDQYRIEYGIHYVTSTFFRKKQSLNTNKGVSDQESYKTRSELQIINEVLKYCDKDKNITSGVLKRKDYSLLRQLMYVFDSWEEFTAEFDLEVKKKIKWTDTVFVILAKKLEEKKCSMKRKDANEIYPGIMNYAQNNLGGWMKAMEFAGVNYTRTRYWSKDKVIPALHDICNNHSYVSNSLMDLEKPRLRKYIAESKIEGGAKELCNNNGIPFKTDEEEKLLSSAIS